MIHWDNLRSEQMVTGHYEGRPVWSNHYMLEFAPPPSKLGSTWNELPESVVAKLLLGVQQVQAHPITGIGKYYPRKDHLFFRAGEIYGQVNRYYWEYFRERYPDMKAFARDAEAMLQIKSKGEMVGLIMPIIPYKAKEHYHASTITDLRAAATLGPPDLAAPHRCRDCAHCSDTHWTWADGYGDGVAICKANLWQPRIRALSMVMRNRPPLREIGAKCELWGPRP